MEVIVNPDLRDWARLQQRAIFDDAHIAQRVEQIIEQVKVDGDEALRQLSQSIDGVNIIDIKVSEVEFKAAREVVSDELKQALNVAAANIRKFHMAQRSEPVDVETMPGVRCVQRSVAIERVGLYVPGGSAPLFSTVLMLAIPAAVAGCKEVILCTPPSKTGGVAAEILYAAELCGVSNVYKVGGAQAIAAMAYSTRTIAAVDKIFGPGNRYVTRAKQLVAGSRVAIDMPAGPSEVMILADESAKAEFVAADMLSQAEHGGDSQAILVCNSRAFADKVERAVSQQLGCLGRSDMTRKALDNSRIVVIDNIEEMVRFANMYAAEHLIISMNEPWTIASLITAAGSIFIGNYTPESAGDYASGTNHTLPTSGWARSYSGVNIDSFVRKVTIQEISPEGLSLLGDTIKVMAQAEGLDAHKNAVEIRLNNIPND